MALRIIGVIIVGLEREVVRNVFSVLAVNPEDLSLIRVLMTLPFKALRPVGGVVVELGLRFTPGARENLGSNPSGPTTNTSGTFLLNLLPFPEQFNFFKVADIF